MENVNNETWLVIDPEGVSWELGCRPSRIGDDRKERPAKRADIVGALAQKGFAPVSSSALTEVIRVFSGLCDWRKEFVEAELAEPRPRAIRMHGMGLTDSMRRLQELFCWTKPPPLKDAVVFVEDEIKRRRTDAEKHQLFWNGLCDILSLSVGTDGETALQDVRELKKSDERLREVIKAAEEAGWNGVENSKILAQYIKDQAAEIGELESQLGDLREAALAFVSAGGSSSDTVWHTRQARLLELAGAGRMTEEQRQQKYAALEADRAARDGKPRPDPKKTLLAALNSMRLSGTDEALLRQMAEDGGVEWSNPDLPEQPVVDPNERIKQLEEELETERMRLAACGVAAIDGREQQAIGPDNAYYSAAYGDVLRVRRDADRLRGEVFSLVEEIKALEAKLREAQASKPTGLPLKELPEAVKIIEHDLERVPGNTITLAKQEVRFLLEVLRAHDDPQNDATDAALPAWWRGHDHTAVEMGKRIDATLKNLGIKAESWQVGLKLLGGPLPMRLRCESCGKLHIDEAEFATKPHHTHACQHCGHVWRPAVFATVGVRFLPGFKNKP